MTIIHEKENEIIQDYCSGLILNKIKIKYGIKEFHLLKIIKKLKASGIETRRGSYKIREEAFLDSINCPEKAYFLGWIFSDGCLHKTNGNIQLGIQNRDSYVLDFFNNFFYGGKRKIYVDFKKDMKIFVVNNPTLYKQCVEIGLHPNKTFDLLFPYGKIPDEYMKHFILGLFDGDGCASFSPTPYSFKYTFSFCGTKDMCLGFSSQIEKFTEVKLNEIEKTKSDNLYLVRTSNKLKIKKIADWLYKDVDFFLKRKFDKFPRDGYLIRKKRGSYSKKTT